VIPVVGVPTNVFPIVADPIQLNGHTYGIKFFLGTDNITLFWRLTDQTTRAVLLDNGQISDDPTFPHPVIDGIQWQVIQPVPGFVNFLCVANAVGVLDPPEYAAFAFNNSGFPTLDGNPPNGLNDRPTDRQQLGEGHWGIHTADNGTRASYQAFLDRISRGGARWSEIMPYDFEWRFTDGGSWTWDVFISGAFFQVPFELWNIGINTPEDPSDDYRLVPWLLDDDASGAFNMGAPGAKGFGTYDHTISSGENDPYTDWVYWYRPQDTSPGEAGYLAAEAEMIAGTYTGDREREIMARFVLVNWNGDIGSPPPSGIYNQDLPETGSIFRILSVKPNFSGDSLAVISLTAIATENTIPGQFYLQQNYPNPFNPVTHIRFGLAQTSRVKLEIYNLLGQKVKTLLNENMLPGRYKATWNGIDEQGNRVSSGIYFYRLKAEAPAGEFVKAEKMILLK
jgi:hypothetical protein